ncbi:MAG: Hpt domain-containing protein, partial [Candidatus Ornithospirochaeta sp.]
RLMNDRLIEKFILKFLSDPSFGELEKAVAEGDAEGEFRASHTLKGVAGNLSFSALASSSSALTEALRGMTGAIPEEANVLFEKTRDDYNTTVSAITSYQSQL